MKTQQPAEGIMLRKDFGDTKSYRITCECSDPEHDHDIWIENDAGEITVTIYTTHYTNFWTEKIPKNYNIKNRLLERFDWFWKNVVNGLYNRLKLTYTFWIKGYVKYESTIMLSKQQALNYAEALKQAIKDLEK